MKKWIWALLIFLVAGGVGGYSVSHYRQEQVQYNRDISNGKIAIERGNYDAAKNYFRQALTTEKNDQDAADLLSQTKKFTRATAEFKRNEFTTARGDYKDVLKYKTASSVLKNRSEAKIKLIHKIKKNVKKFNQKLGNAKKMNAVWNFYGSNTELDGLFSNTEFSRSYYKTLYEEATTLQRFNNAGIVADQTSFGAATTTPSNKTNLPSAKPQYGGPGPATKSTAKPAKKTDSNDAKSTKSSSKKEDHSSDSTSKNDKQSSQNNQKQTEKESSKAD